MLAFAKAAERIVSQLLIAEMEHIKLTAYLENNPQSKRLNKRMARALKTYLHSVKDLRHAAADIAHSKEDCVFAIQSADQMIDDCHGLLEEWTFSKVPEQDSPSQDPEGQGASRIEESEKSNSGSLGQVEDHLRHAAKDIGHALQDAKSALRDLKKVDEFLLDLIEMAANDGYVITITDAKASLLLAASEAEAAKATPPAAGDSSENP